jgi:hypothetical protein
MVGKRNACRVLEGKLDGKRSLGEPRRRFDFNIKLHLEESGWEVVDWIYLAQVRHEGQILVNRVMYIRVPLNGGDYLTSYLNVKLRKKDSAV